MAQVKPTFEEVEDFKDIAKKIIEKYPDYFGHIDMEKIKCLAINNKDRADGKKLWEVKAIPDFALNDCKYTHYVVIYLSDWVSFTEKLKARMICDILFAIPDESGKVRSFDLKGFTPIIRIFGTNYMDEDSGPDPLNEDINWMQ